MTWRSEVAGFDRMAADYEETALADPAFALAAVHGWAVDEVERRTGAVPGSVPAAFPRSAPGSVPAAVPGAAPGVVPAAVPGARRSLILDVGCGTGLLLEALAGRGHQVVGVEPSAGMRAEASHRRPWLNLLDGHLAAIPLPDASVDGVVTTYAISHLARDEKPAAFAELLRVVRPGGAVVVADVGVGSAEDLAEVAAALRAGGREAQLPYYADGHALEIDVWEPWLRARLGDVAIVRLSALAWGLSGTR
jgi:SAM-dependent methyltransferase